MDDAQLTRRLSILEAQVKLLSDHLGLASPAFAGTTDSTPRADGDGNGDAVTGSSVAEEVLQLARAGKTTQAISLQRKLTGASLLEAKTTVESL